MHCSYCLYKPDIVNFILKGVTLERSRHKHTINWFLVYMIGWSGACTRLTFISIVGGSEWPADNQAGGSIADETRWLADQGSVPISTSSHSQKQDSCTFRRQAHPSAVWKLGQLAPAWRSMFWIECPLSLPSLFVCLRLQSTFCNSLENRTNRIVIK